MQLKVWTYNGPVIGLGALCIVINGSGIGPLWMTGVALLLLGMLMRFAMSRAQRPPEGAADAPVPSLLPVHGRWMARNGPATKVPSHTHHLAQTYAIDLAYAPAPASDGPPTAPGGDGTGPPFRWLWPLARRPESYPAFGRPLLAPADGTVVAAQDGQRDHLTRSSLPGILYVLLEGFVRSCGAPRHLLGNHLVLDLGGGTFALFAHVRRGSRRVEVGERVTAGQPLAECGNSGQSSQPHLHFQLMSEADPARAHGLPFRWRYQDDDGTLQEGAPRDMTALAPPEESEHPGPPTGDEAPGTA